MPQQPAYLVSEGEELHDALDGEEEGEDQVAIRQDVGELERCSVILNKKQYRVKRISKITIMIY